MARTPRLLIYIHHFFKYSYWTLDSSYQWEHIFLLIIQKHGKNLSLHFVSQICIFRISNEKSFNKILAEGSIWDQLYEYISPALLFCFKSPFLCTLITRVLCFSWRVGGCMVRTPRWLIYIQHFFKYSYWTLDSSYWWEHIFLLIIQKHGKICLFTSFHKFAFFVLGMKNPSTRFW